MTTVLLFLFLMILLIQLTSYLTRGATAREIEGIRIARELLAQKKKKAAASSDTDEDIAVIAAAVTASTAPAGARSTTASGRADGHRPLRPDARLPAPR